MPPRPPLLPPPATTRLARLFLGLTLCGVGIALMVAADLGLGPWDVLHQGLSDLSGVPIGTVAILVGFVVLLGWIPLRERPGVGTVANAVWIGLTIDVILELGGLTTPDELWLRWLMMLSGPVLFGVGSGYYIGAGLGPGPRDGLMTGLARRGLRVDVVRTGIELTALATGWMLGGTAGLGTIWFAVAIGPVVAWCLPRMAVDEDLLERRGATATSTATEG